MTLYEHSHVYTCTCAVLLCLVCLFALKLLVSFFLPSHLSFKNMYILCVHAYTCIYMHILCIDFVLALWASTASYLKTSRPVSGLVQLSQAIKAGVCNLWLPLFISQHSHTVDIYMTL